ncbi:hypothetical protein VG539_002367 [Cronobacter muytjensii]|uniref:hypothetical protein n=1 Tax=Cronobacter muytjensii TaxID=413501 RepID=UPI00028405E8|nr:hypothetical protein [Cronobacter muytjensii]MDI6454737.1 hypothetical protein [Cronobacter muytjensii]
MQECFWESVKLQRIDFFMKLVAASDCNDEEKRLAIQWVSELTDELMAKIRSHEYCRSMDVTS